MDERDVDARFASIVARWDGPVPDADAPLPDAHADADALDADADADADGRAADDEPGAADAGPAQQPLEGDSATPGTEPEDGAPDEKPVAPRSPWVNPSPLDVVVPASAWRAAEPRDPATQAAAEQAEAALTDDDEHFEPPEVVLPPQEDLHFWGAVIGLVAGPLMLLWVVFARPTHSTRWFAVSVVVSLVGFGLLILRQPKHRDPTSGDNGARV
jgi:hypothetical protein